MFRSFDSTPSKAAYSLLFDARFQAGSAPDWLFGRPAPSLVAAVPLPRPRPVETNPALRDSPLTVPPDNRTLLQKLSASGPRHACVSISRWRAPERRTRSRVSWLRQSHRCRRHPCAHRLHAKWVETGGALRIRQFNRRSGPCERTKRWRDATKMARLKIPMQDQPRFAETSSRARIAGHLPA